MLDLDRPFFYNPWKNGTSTFLERCNGRPLLSIPPYYYVHTKISDVQSGVHTDRYYASDIVSIAHTCSPYQHYSGCRKYLHTELGPSDFLNRQHLLLSYRVDHWLCAGGLLAANAIGAQLRDPIDSGLTRWRLTVWMDAVVESGIKGTRYLLCIVPPSITYQAAADYDALVE